MIRHECRIIIESNIKTGTLDVRLNFIIDLKGWRNFILGMRTRSAFIKFSQIYPRRIPVEY